MTSTQLGEALVKVAGDLELANAFAAADCLEDKVSMLRKHGFDVDPSDFAGLAKVVMEVQSKGELTDEELRGAQGGFIGDIIGSSIGLGLGAYFGGIVGASLGLEVGRQLGAVIDDAIGAAVKSDVYDNMNNIFSPP